MGIRADKARFGVTGRLVPLRRGAKANLSSLGGVTTQIEFRDKVGKKQTDAPEIEEG